MGLITPALHDGANPLPGVRVGQKRYQLLLLRPHTRLDDLLRFDFRQFFQLLAGRDLQVLLVQVLGDRLGPQLQLLLQLVLFQDEFVFLDLFLEIAVFLLVLIGGCLKLQFEVVVC